MSLTRVLSGEMLPLVPSGLDPKLDKYCRDLSNYLRRLAGRFTGQNILNTIIEEVNTTLVTTIQGAGAFSLTCTKRIDVTSGTNVITTLSTEDWRGRPLIGMYGYPATGGADTSDWASAGSITVVTDFIGSATVTDTLLGGFTDGYTNTYAFTIKGTTGYLVCDTTYGGSVAGVGQITLYAGAVKSASDVTI